MTEEKLKKYIEGKRQADGARSPFKVPEGYFDTLCDRVMAQIPEEQTLKVVKKPLRRRISPMVWKCAAMLVVGMIAGISFYVTHRSATEPSDIQLAQAEIVEQEVEPVYYDEQYYSDALDYAMVDNNEIALYLTEF